MKWTDNTQIELGQEDLDLLVWNVPNEVINGLRIDNFKERIGASEEQFKSIANRLRSLSKSESSVVLSAHESELFRNALVLTLDELGVGEFEIRTGHGFSKGIETLRELDEFLHGER